MVRVNDSIAKEKNNQQYNGTVTTALTEKIERILVQKIEVKTYFGNDVLDFHKRHEQDVSVWFTVNVTIKSATYPITKTEYIFESDSKSIQERKATINDIVLVYIYLKIPIKLDIKTSYADFFHLDLNPTAGHKHTVARNGFHQWIPTCNNKESYGIEEANNIELLVKQLHIYLRPNAIRYVEPGNPSKNGTIIEGTMRSNSLFHTDEDWWFNPKDYKYDETLMRLGKVILQANSSIEGNMTVLDTRTRGGGLDDTLSKEIIRQVNQESLYNWDLGYFDGEAYQENGVIIIRLPKSILRSEKNPEGFHESEVQAAIAKHKGYGVLPIIEYCDEVNDEYKYNIISNPEFLDWNHVGYYNSNQSKGDYEIVYDKEAGSGDNFVLEMQNDAEYVITIPGHKLRENRYRVDIKARKLSESSIRHAGEIYVKYKNGTSLSVLLSEVKYNNWMIYKDLISVNENIHSVTITLNKSHASRTGKIIYDYVMLIPDPYVSDDTNEIHEI